jgi:hypothetical protein
MCGAVRDVPDTDTPLLFLAPLEKSSLQVKQRSDGR